MESNNKNKAIDWEQRRYEIAKDFLCAFRANSSKDVITIFYVEEIIGYAIEAADELIKQLKARSYESK